MWLFLLCLLSLTGPIARAEINESIQYTQGAVEHFYDDLKHHDVSANVTDEDHNALNYSCLQDPRCLDEKVGHELRIRAPEGTIVRALVVLGKPNPKEKKSWAMLLQNGEASPFKINGHRVSSHQVLEIKVPSSAESYIFDPVILNTTKLQLRSNWEEMFDAPNGVIFKSVDIP
jgi:hypothetical protein